jgi:hypothetical protein
MADTMHGYMDTMPDTSSERCEFFGPGGIRTCNPWEREIVQCQLGYMRIKSETRFRPGCDSNLRSCNFGKRLATIFHINQ